MLEPEQLKLVETTELCQAAECLKVLAHPVRLRLIDIMMQGLYPVATLAELCELPPHQTCEHLRLMQGHGLLTSKREGRQVFYELAAPQLAGIMSCIRSHCGSIR